MNGVIRVSRSRAASSILLAVGLVLLLSAAATAQTRPTALAYAGPSCFATVLTTGPGEGPRIGHFREGGQVIGASPELVYIDGGEMLTVGEQYRLLRDEGEISAPTGESVGHAVRFVGIVEVVEVLGERALGRLSATCAEVEQGDVLQQFGDGDILVDPDVPPFDVAQLVDPQPADATIVFGSAETISLDEGGRGSRHLRETYGAGDVVTIDQGVGESWRSGDVAVVYQVGALPGDSPSVGRDDVVVLGQAVAIWVRDETATLLLTAGDQAVRVGTRVRRLGR